MHHFWWVFQVKKHCDELISQYNENFTAFASALDEYSVVSKLTDADFPYIYALLMDLPNTRIAERLNVSSRTVKRRLEALCAKLGVPSKKELKDYLHNYM